MSGRAKRLVRVLLNSSSDRRAGPWRPRLENSSSATKQFSTGQTANHSRLSSGNGRSSPENIPERDLRGATFGPSAGLTASHTALRVSVLRHANGPYNFSATSFAVAIKTAPDNLRDFSRLQSNNCADVLGDTSNKWQKN